MTWRRPTLGGALFRGAHEIDEVAALDLIELQSPGDGVKNVLGHTADGAALELCVVLDADPREHGDLLATHPADAPAGAVAAQPGLLGRDAPPTAGKELADLAAGSH